VIYHYKALPMKISSKPHLYACADELSYKDNHQIMMTIQLIFIETTFIVIIPNHNEDQRNITMIM
jgi:hypothetical protein